MHKIRVDCVQLTLLQSETLEEPALAVMYAAAHAVQTVDPEAEEYVPIAQGTQDPEDAN